MPFSLIVVVKLVPKTISEWLWSVVIESFVLNDRGSIDDSRLEAFILVRFTSAM